MGISEKVCNRLRSAVRQALSVHQYGDITDEKIDSIRDEILPLLMSMYKDNMLFDYAFGVYGKRDSDLIKLKLDVCLTPGGDMLNLGSELKVRNTIGQNEDSFDRAMKGV